MHENDFPIKPYVPQQATPVFQGARFDVLIAKQEKGQRELVNHPGAVVILPILTGNRVVMIQNERFAVGETLWELPAGTLEPGESPEFTAVRELKEETGYRCKIISLITDFYTTPGFCNERIYAYLATGLEEGPQQLEETEKITVAIFTVEETLQMIKSHEIKDGKTIATLLYYNTFL